MDTACFINEITNLRHQLHEIPELSFQEEKTKVLLMQTLKEKTDLQVVDCGQWFYAHFPGNRKDDGSDTNENSHSAQSSQSAQSFQSSHVQKPIAFRADFDAVKGGDGAAHHLCGHDGHASILVGLGMYISQHKPEREIYLVFQPAEEIGKGAEICLPLLLEKGVSEIYGFHNIPGFPKKSVLLLKDTFACASTGLEIKITGSVSHAAYPEAGKNPAKIISKLILEQDKIVQDCQERFGGLVRSTVIGAEIGSESYGVSAGEGVLRLTLRAEKEEAFQKLKEDICRLAEELCGQKDFKLDNSDKEGCDLAEDLSGQKSFGQEGCDQEGCDQEGCDQEGCGQEENLSGQKSFKLDSCNKEDCNKEEFKCSFRWIEEFPATVNNHDCVEKVRSAAQKAGKEILTPEEPFRWSEDFGHYLQKIPGAFFGVGSGEDTPQLHTEKYEFPDDIMETVMEIYAGIIG